MELLILHGQKYCIRIANIILLISKIYYTSLTRVKHVLNLLNRYIILLLYKILLFNVVKNRWMALIV
jgi:hypothetical protein